jgi:hypothetical protein
MLLRMKRRVLSLRRSPEKGHRAVKRGAKANGRRVKGEAIVWLEGQIPEKPVTGKEAAALLRKFYKMFTPKEHKEIAASIEEARRCMAHEHLH